MYRCQMLGTVLLATVSASVYQGRWQKTAQWQHFIILLISIKLKVTIRSACLDSVFIVITTTVILQMPELFGYFSESNKLLTWRFFIWQFVITVRTPVIQPLNWSRRWYSPWVSSVFVVSWSFCQSLSHHVCVA